MFFTLFLLIFSGKLLFAMADDLLYTKQRYPGVAQLVARQLWELDAAGSNPVTRTIKRSCCIIAAALFLFHESRNIVFSYLSQLFMVFMSTSEYNDLILRNEV